MYNEIQSLVLNLNIEITIKEIIKIKQKNPSTFLGIGNLLRLKDKIIKYKIDLLIINKADLAPYVGVDLQAMEKDVKNARREMPYVFGEMKNFKGIDNISDFLFLEGGL